MKGLKNLLKFTALGAVAGGAAAAGSAQVGHRKAAQNEGLRVGAVIGAAAAVLPKIVFRKVKGRIIPMRSK